MAIHAQWVWGHPSVDKAAIIAAEGYNAVWLSHPPARRPFSKCAGKTAIVINDFLFPTDSRTLQIIRSILFGRVPASITQLIIISIYPIEDCLPASLAEHFVVRHLTEHDSPDDYESWTIISSTD
jgi:hypothetical protein